MTDTVPQRCPLCGATEHSWIRQFSDGVVVGRCSRCGLCYTPRRHARPEGVLGAGSLQELRSAYGPMLRDEVAHYRERNYRSYLSIVEAHASGRTLLDVGCAHGFFGRAARKRGFHVTGVEPHPAMAALARDDVGLEVLTGRLEDVDLGDRRWDVISFTDSLEYLTTPVEALTRLRRHLTPRGIVFVKVPNGAHDRVRLTASRLPFLSGEGAFDPSRRVAHYDLETLRTLGDSAGYDARARGAVRPVDSPTWHRNTGVWREMASPWYRDPAAKVARRVFDALGRVEGWIFRGRNHLSPAIYAVFTPRDGG